MAAAKIMIVDDDPGIRQMLAIVLSLEGYEPVECSRPLSFFEDLKREDPDLILLDLQMPEVDGLTLLKQMKAEGGAHQPPVVLLTGKDIETQLAEPPEHPAGLAIVSKPFEKAELLRQLEMLLRAAA